MLEKIRSNVRRMRELIDDLLRFARLGRQPLEMQRIEPAGIVNTVLSTLQAGPAGRQVEVIVHDLPACQGDASLLTQVWLNLLSNAFKYSQKREAARIEVGSLVNDDGETIYYVKDNGVGFDMRYASKLFGVFQRLHGESEFEGTGVGLAIVQRIVQRHGGRVWAEAQLDRGATFFFTLGTD